MRKAIALATLLGSIAAILLIARQRAWSHCDTLDGPVVTRARQALETGNVKLVLPWVAEQDEAEIQAAFDHARAVRKLGPEAQKLADQFFFETLVRVHRASEGEPYTGLKPAGTDLPLIIPAADQALETGSVDEVVELVTHTARDGLETRFKEARERKRHADESVAAGREYVHAYVQFLHYAERLYRDATGTAGEHGAEAAGHGAEHEH
jgi:hypothetical protein